VARLFAVVGALLFAGSLGFFGWWYLGPFSAEDSVDPAASGAVRAALLWNVSSFTVFALHHSILARSGLKPLVVRLVSPALERPVYVWVASVLFYWVCWSWRPVPGVVWFAGAWWPLLCAVQLAGIVLSVRSARRLGLVDLSGIREASGQARPSPATVTTEGLYRFVRHPIYFGWLLIVWPTPEMTGTRLVFAATSSLYLVIAIWFEERDLALNLGAAYEQYCRQVPWKLIPYVY
jgi:methanethiol S-methyltransferase